MPTCDPQLLTPVVQTIIRFNPLSVLDIGIGMGKWGVLAREYIEAWCHQQFYKDQWQSRIDGIEIYEKYRTPAWDVYDHVFIGDALDVLRKSTKYDLILMIDVLEHFQKDRGLILLDLIRQQSKYALISYSNTEQKDVCENKFEDHISKWDFQDFLPLKAEPLLTHDSWGLVGIPGI